MSRVLRPLTAQDLDQAWALDQELFNTSGSPRAAFDAQAPPERFHGIFENGRLLAMSRVLPFGQYFGGKRLPMGGLSSVGVAPDVRGQGLAGRVVSASLADMRERGECVSSLFPGTTSLYRTLGWELAGAFVIRRIPATALRSLGAPESGRVRRGERAHVPEIKALYARIAERTSGFLERAAPRWVHLEALFDEQLVYVTVDADGELDGYVAYRQLPTVPGEFGFVIRVRDLFAGNRGALTALWALLGSSSTQAETIEYVSSPEDPLLLLLDEQREVVHGDIRWMLRIVHAEAAIAARGYAPGLAGTVSFTLEEAAACTRHEELAGLGDDQAGAYRLEVSDGEGRLERIRGTPGLRFGVGAFASLFSGWAQTTTLERLGLLSGGSRGERAMLDGIFAGPTPWLPEEF